MWEFNLLKTINFGKIASILNEITLCANNVYWWHVSIQFLNQLIRSTNKWTVEIPYALKIANQNSTQYFTVTFSMS